MTHPSTSFAALSVERHEAIARGLRAAAALRAVPEAAEVGE